MELLTNEELDEFESPIPADPEAPTRIKVIEDYARMARGDSFYDKLYQLALYMSGDVQELDRLRENGFAKYHDADQDLAWYPHINPALGPAGVSNQLLINSRINIQAVVYSSPRFIIPTDEPLLREIIHAWLLDVWEEIDFSGKSYETGLDTECFGVGFCEFGINDGGPAASPFSPLDCIWDSYVRSPGDWRYFFRRERLDIDAAWRKYGHVLSMEELEDLAVDAAVERKSDKDGVSARPDPEQSKVIVEWRYWDQNTHVVFLGGIQDNERRVMLGFPDGELTMYQRIDAPAPNPFGIIPIGVWVDSMAPLVRQPTGKAETAIRPTSLVNAIEGATAELIDKAPPRFILSTVGLQPEIIEKLKDPSFRSLKGIGDLIITDAENVKDALMVTPAADIPSAWFQVRSVLKEEINAATGVMDSMRAVTRPGERSAAEVRINEQNGAIQSRHTQKQYQRFLKTSINILIKLGAKYDTKRRMLALSNGFVDTEVFPMKPFLNFPLPVTVQEDSLRYVTDEDRKQRRMIQLASVDIPAIDYGVADPYKVFESVYKDLGLKDPTSILYTREEYDARQQQKMLAEMMAAQQPRAGSENNGRAAA